MTWLRAINIGAYENIRRPRRFWSSIPNDRVQITTKLEYSEIDKDPEATVLCLTEGVRCYNRNQDGNRSGRRRWQQGNERSIWALLRRASAGTRTTRRSRTSCGDDLGKAASATAVRSSRRPRIFVRKTRTSVRSMRARPSMSSSAVVGVNGGLDNTGETIESTNAYVNLDYELNDNLTLSWFDRLQRLGSCRFARQQQHAVPVELPGSR